MSTRDGSSLVGGRVEICNDGRYGSVCDLNWDNDDAQVACTNFFGQASDYVFGMSYFSVYLGSCQIQCLPQMVKG